MGGLVWPISGGEWMRMRMLGAVGMLACWNGLGSLDASAVSVGDIPEFHLPAQLNRKRPSNFVTESV